MTRSRFSSALEKPARTRARRQEWRPHGLLLTLVALTPLSAQTPDFAKVYAVLEAGNCRACHTHAGVASGTRLHFPDKDASPNEIQSFGLSLSALVDRADPAKSPLANKPTMRIAHTGGERIKPGSPEDRLLTAWVEYLAGTPEDQIVAARRRLGDSAGAPRPIQLVRRLTHSQYNNTVRDLLGDFSKPAARFPEEDYVDGFKNQLRMQSMPPLLVEVYSSTAEKLAANAFRIGDINGLIPCNPAAAGDTRCRDRFIRQFGMKAFRRPLRDSEIRRYTQAFAEQARQSGKFLEGARAVVEAMLQSPKFLFHLEAGPDGKSVDYDVASRLSYFLWDTMPDQTLFDAAASGGLRTAAGREKHARRMLADPRAREALDEFFIEWLRLDRVPNAVKERRRFPEFTAELAASMVEETRKLLHHIVWNDRNFLEVFTAGYSFLTSDLATLYQAPKPPAEFELTKFPGDLPRAGLLGHASLLTSTSGPADTSPTARGLFIREQFLCQHVPPPPPGVNTQLPEPTEGKAKTKTQLMVEHVSNPACSSCHRLMDPIGFGLEGYDAIGKHRDKEAIFLAAATESGRNAGRRVELPLEPKGEIAGLPASGFTDARRLGRILADSPVCQECVVRQMFRYAYGRLETPADQEAIAQLFTRFKESGFKFRELVVAIVTSPEFTRGLGAVPASGQKRSAGSRDGARRDGARFTLAAGSDIKQTAREGR
jgi:hypothetical protein